MTSVLNHEGDMHFHQLNRSAFELKKQFGSLKEVLINHMGEATLFITITNFMSSAADSIPAM